VQTDAEAGRLVNERCRTGAEIPPIGLLGGDLCRTLGGRGDEAHLRGPDSIELPIDVGAVLVDGRLHRFVAHLVARRRLWSGEVVVAMNAEWCGSLCLGPRAHPGDGLLDVTRGTLSPADRLKARRRARSGSHLPHPNLRVERVSALQASFERPVDVWLDGVRVGTARSLSVRVEPARLRCYV
jgi:hypothetical protein